MCSRRAGGGDRPHNGNRPREHDPDLQSRIRTKKTGHGFGLHSGALAAKELGGELRAHSDGPGSGATLVSELPLTSS